MAAIDPHQMMTCPYIKAHQVEHYRMQYHLEKCRKQYPNCKKVTCPFDAKHVVNDVELDYHVQTCPKRILFDIQKYVVEDDARPLEVMTPAPVPTEENWDDDNVTSYKPDPTKKGHVLVRARGMTRSERKKFRMECIRNFKPQEQQ